MKYSASDSFRRSVVEPVMANRLDGMTTSYHVRNDWASMSLDEFAWDCGDCADVLSSIYSGLAGESEHRASR